jgi:hypothetical protein
MTPDERARKERDANRERIHKFREECDRATREPRPAIAVMNDYRPPRVLA